MKAMVLTAEPILTEAEVERQPWLERGRIPSLDGLRATSILLVIVAHVAHTPTSPIPHRFHWLTDRGAIGVDVFFAISGFLITILLVREQERSETISLKGFYARRAFRILPAYFAYLLWILLLNCLGWVAITGRDWAVALSYTVSFFSASWQLGHVWSLSVEEHFYLLWPPLLLLLGRMRAKHLTIGVLVAEPAVRWLIWRFVQH